MMAYLDWQALSGILALAGRTVFGSGGALAAAWLAGGLSLAVLVVLVLLVVMPRLVEDYVRLHHWYVNSDFYLIFGEKVDIRFIFRLVLLPVTLTVMLAAGALNLVVGTAYRLAFRLNLLRCVHCGAGIEWEEGTVLCHLCGEKVTGTAVKTCPGCHFKPNAVRCPFCGYIVFVGLEGQPPSGRALDSRQNKDGTQA
jgi:hypothetical protein